MIGAFMLMLEKIGQGGKMAKYLGVLRIIAAFGPSIKKWVFADGSFASDRAFILLLSAVLLVFGIEYFGAATIEIALTFLDQLSDMFGYVD